MIGVRFQPAGAMRFLKTSMHEFRDQIVDFKDWSPKCSGELEEAVLEANDSHHRIQIIQQFLMKQLDDGRPDLVLSALVRKIQNSGGHAKN